MKSTIDGWCDSVGVERPHPPDYSAVETNLRQQMPSSEPEIRVSEQELLRAVADRAPVIYHHADSELMNRTRLDNSTSSSDKSEEEIYTKLKSSDIFDQEQGLIMMRKMTRTRDEARVSLCSSRILALLKSMIVSRYSLVQTNSGFPRESIAGEDQQVDDRVLGALQPLLHALRAAESDRTRHDAGLALYHLSLNQTNRLKLVSEGRSAMLDANAVAILVGKLREEEESSRSSAAARENCVAALFALSQFEV
ncbi:hypothetical protein Bca52824_055782 [Brassica carinata]|uniref:Uncharacterized protein n=1 Tax=Brassica carinata TaxID=52824 RepID=A0A8X7RBD6_BRACI|nr:hypothetical protein Bca52824_055782 [Brassica carinata]